MTNDKLISIFSILAEDLKTSQHRGKFSKENVNEIKGLLQHMTLDNDGIMLAYHMLRCLRNACVHSTKNQNLIVDSDILDMFQTIMEKILSPDLAKNSPVEESIKKLKIVSVQFLGNLVVQNPISQLAVWKIGFPKLFFTMMSNFGLKEKDFLCMVVYNCLKNRRELYSNKDEFWFLVSIIEYCKDHHDADWGLLVMELLISSESFIPFFKELNEYSGLRSSMVELIIAHLEETDDGPSKIPEKNLLHFCEEFSTKSTCILRLATSHSPELEEEACLLLKILSLICSATSIVGKYQEIRRNQKFMKTILELLKQMQSLRKEKTNRETLPPDHPVIGFERDMVRVIANMLYKNKYVQEQVRELHGIEVLLNACNIDNSNPYIMQWGVFAIKNLCENNTTNQQYISSLDQQGIVSDDILRQHALQARLENGKIKVTNIKH